MLDQAEQAMLAVAEKRVGEGLEVLGGLLSKVLERLEQVESEGLDVTGLPTGLVDLDRISWGACSRPPWWWWPGVRGWARAPWR